MLRYRLSINRLSIIGLLALAITAAIAPIHNTHAFVMGIHHQKNNSSAVPLNNLTPPKEGYYRYGDGVFYWPDYHYKINSIEKTPDGGYILAGRYDNNKTGSGDQDSAWLAKLDKNQNIVWQKTFAFPHDGLIGNGLSPEFFKAQPTSDGGYIAVGALHESVGNAAVVKTDKDGNIKWGKIFSSFYGHFYDVVEVNGDSGGTTPAGGHTTTGQTSTTGGSGGGGPVQKATAAIEPGYVMVGYYETYVEAGPYSHADTGVVAIKLSVDGQSIWNKRVIGPSKSQPVGGYAMQRTRGKTIHVTSNNNFLISANSFYVTTQSYGPPVIDIYDHSIIFFELDPFGELVSEKGMTTPDYTTVTAVTPTKDKGYIAVGYINTKKEYTYKNRKSFALKMDKDNTITWFKTYNTNTSADSTLVANDVLQLTDGSYIMIGSVGNNSVLGNDANVDSWMVKLNNTGDIVWQRALSLGNNVAFLNSVVKKDNDTFLAVGGFSGINPQFTKAINDALFMNIDANGYAGDCVPKVNSIATVSNANSQFFAPHLSVDSFNLSAQAISAFKPVLAKKTAQCFAN
jgi:hypothetical protein